MTFDLYVWKAPRDLDDGQAEALVERWHEAGGDPRTSPFEASSDVGWFVRELRHDEPGLDMTSDATPTTSTAPIWLAATDEPPARVVAIRMPDPSREALETIVGLAVKYDLVVFDARLRRVHLPMAAMAAAASATFWPAGAIQAGLVGGIGGVIAIVAWSLAIPLLSGLVASIGAFLFVMAVITFIHAGLIAIRARRGTDGPAPPG